MNGIDIESLLDRELMTRKVSLSRETRSICLTVIKAALSSYGNSPTPVDGTPIKLTPEAKERIEKTLAEMRARPNKIVVIEESSPYGTCPEHGESLLPSGNCPKCFHNPHTRYEPKRDL